MSFNWTCPHCASPQTVATDQTRSGIIDFSIKGQAEGAIGLQGSAIACCNPQCLRTTIAVEVAQLAYSYGDPYLPGPSPRFFEQRIIPSGSSKPQPELIPEALRDDYYEACLIRDLSPKASATLIRRCLQGMIRDFAGIVKGTLNAEILALRAAVDDGSADRAITPETVDAIDHVRKVGNIGAHMEKDINLIVEVQPGEAQALIELVELLFEEWYIARENRRRKLAHIADIALDKEEARTGPPLLAKE